MPPFFKAEKIDECGYNFGGRPRKKIKTINE